MFEDQVISIHFLRDSAQQFALSIRYKTIASDTIVKFLQSNKQFYSKNNINFINNLLLI